MGPGAGDEQADGQEGKDRQKGGQQPPGDHRRRKALTGKDHRKPPFEEGPPRPLAHCAGHGEDVIRVVGDVRRRDLDEEIGKPGLQAAVRLERAHAS